MTGLIDLAYPALDLIDAGLALALPAWARVMAFGVVSALVTMGLYTALSNQQAIKAQKVRLKEIQGQLKASQDDLGETMRLTRANLATSFGILGRVIGPALLSSLPVIVVIGWLAVHWSHAEPAPGTSVAVELAPSAVGVTLEPPSLLDGSAPGMAMLWPPAGTELRLAHQGTPLWTGSPAALATTAEVAQPRWWNLFLGNPAGYLEAGAGLDRMSVELPARELLGFGPGWMRGWEFVYFLTVICVSLGLKAAFRIA